MDGVVRTYCSVRAQAMLPDGLEEASSKRLENSVEGRLNVFTFIEEKSELVDAGRKCSGGESKSNQAN